MKPRWIIAAAAALALGLLTLPLLRGGGQEQIKPTSPAARAEGASCDAEGRAKLDFVLKNEHNVPVKLADYKGKVVLVNFWATWCGPCKYEIPMFVDLQQRYGAQGLSFLGISVDDPVEELKPFVDQYKMNYPVLVGLGREEVQEAYGPMVGIPVTVVIGRDGNLCTRYFGLRAKDRFEADIKALL